MFEYWIAFRCTTAQTPSGQAHMSIKPNNLFLEVNAGNGQALFIK